MIGFVASRAWDKHGTLAIVGIEAFSLKTQLKWASLIGQLYLFSSDGW